MRLLVALLFTAAPAFAASAAELAQAIAGLSLDPGECYRIRDLTIAREDARFYLTDGYLIFAKPVGEARIAAVFTADVEGGDAEVLLMPPTRSERRSLASYSGSPNLDEHFDAAVFVFSDDSYAEVTAALRANPFNRKIPEIGMVLGDKWSATARNIANSFETRLVLDLLSQQPGQGFFTAALHGRKTGNLDVTYDPQALEQILVGQIAYRDNRPYLDIWTSFEALSFRKGLRRHAPAPFAARDYRIEARLDPDLLLHVETRLKLKVSDGGRVVVPLEISPQMRITAARIDGTQAAVHRAESLRSNLIRNNGNELFLVVGAQPLEAGREYEIEVRGEGTVIRNAGNHVYFVGARSNWYPRYAAQFATYDMTFRYPKELDLVTAGDVVSDKTEGEWRITRRRTAAPIRFAGFNLGAYERIKVSRAGYTVEVCANRRVERALEPKAPEPSVPLPPTWGRRRQPSLEPPASSLPLPPPNPTTKLQELAAEIAAEMEFMAARFGPPSLRSLTVSPVPGTFGQGFPGLIYLSTLSYVAPAMPLDPRTQLFFTELLHAHETAHQWWGNIVTADAYHDAWLMEALANYSGMLFVEKRKGARTLEAVLNGYRDNLLKKAGGGEIVDAAGPIVMGPRLESSLTPDAWRHIVYGKGSWIVHMLRRRMGDEKFLAMLAQLRRRYEWQSITTEQFRQLAAAYLPPKSPDPKLEAFFDQWVYSTGIPALKLAASIKGVRVTGTLTQSEVSDDFSVPVPIEIQFARGKPVTHWVQSASEPVRFTVTLKQPPSKVVLDPGQSVLRR